ncbi:MAG: hypothetical protein M1838_001422 [Thelocarpon superellum]|nr:MAG: hypothetical protein M1838_001422 [Thelocarpon superellum]
MQQHKAANSLHLKDKDPARERMVQGTDALTHGTYELLDRLTLQTEAGGINVVILPQPAASDALPHHPAYFTATSRSGGLYVLFPTTLARVPPRAYHTFVAALRGNLTGRFVIGATTSLKAYQGSIDAVLFALDPTAPSKLMLGARGGPLRAQIHNARPVHPLRALHTTITAVMSSVVLTAPPSWEGKVTVHARPETPIGVAGHGVKLLLHERDEKGMKVVVALRESATPAAEAAGPGSTIDIHSAGGRIHVDLL